MRKLLAIILTVLSVLSFSACNPDTAPSEGYAWAFYWYLCGSDLESGSGFASIDLKELSEVSLPEDVVFYIQTGGSSAWQNEMVSADTLQRYAYDSQGLHLLEEQPSASMGESSTLADFLAYGKAHFPAQKTGVIFWNHGGGSVAGIAFDELYNGDSLTLTEMRRAFSSVWPLSEEQPPLELIGFDACLMATVDVAAAFTDIGRYLVASEESEPANGWYYSGWVPHVAAGVDGETLGRVICDTFLEGCTLSGTQDEATLSLTDLSRVRELLESYEEFGKSALAAACKDPGFFSRFARIATQTENYGGNTREQGYTNMADLGGLAKRSAESLPSAERVLSALDNAVLYKVNGKYRTASNGLSCYYPYSADTEDLNLYCLQGTGKAFKYFFQYGLTGSLDQDGLLFLSDMDSALPKDETVSPEDWDGIRPVVDKDGFASVTLGPKADACLISVGFELYATDDDGNVTLTLGSDNDLTGDWEKGVFTDNFRGVWGALNGIPVYMELSGEGEDYNLYSIPVLLNGEEANMSVVYDFTDEEWSVIGTRKPLSENGCADKELHLLVPGDEITVLHFTASSDGGEELLPIEAGTVTVTDSFAFGEAPLEDGNYTMLFSFTDRQGNVTHSAPIYIQIKNGELYTFAE